MFYTVNQIAEKLQLSQQCIYQLVESGKLVAHRFGNGRGTLRISEADLDAFIERSRQEWQALSPAKPRPRSRLRHLKL